MCNDIICVCFNDVAIENVYCTSIVSVRTTNGSAPVRNVQVRTPVNSTNLYSFTISQHFFYYYLLIRSVDREVERG